MYCLTFNLVFNSNVVRTKIYFPMKESADNDLMLVSFEMIVWCQTVNDKNISHCKNINVVPQLNRVFMKH